VSHDVSGVSEPRITKPTGSRESVNGEAVTVGMSAKGNYRLAKTKAVQFIRTASEPPLAELHEGWCKVEWNDRSTIGGLSWFSIFGATC